VRRWGWIQDARLGAHPGQRGNSPSADSTGRGLEQPNDGPACPSLAWVPPSLAEDFMGPRAALPEDRQHQSNICADLFHPGAGSVGCRSRAGTGAVQGVLQPEGFRRIKAVRRASPTWGINRVHPLCEPLAHGRFLVCKRRQLGQTANHALHALFLGNAGARPQPSTAPLNSRSLP